ncbi:MAG: hypothetical protein DLM59_16955 [Pseudonocardiales bacterium]|nr:MAG: hypothetical protein DLM59_16955 [Pseudonocardiales bacterium]
MLPAPSTVHRIERVLTSAGGDLIDGSISAPPPHAEAEPARVYVCGPRAGKFVDLPNPWLDIVSTGAGGSRVGSKDVYGVVRAEFLADTRRAWPDDDEMHEIART